MIVSGPWCGFLLSRIQKHFPQPKRRRTLPPAPVVAVEEVAEDEGHDELPELPEEHSAWSDVAGDGEVEQGEEGHEEQEQHEEVEQEEEGHEEQEAVEVEVEVEDEVQEGGGDGDEWSDFSSRDPVLTLSLFGAVCFRACGTITLNLST